MRAPYTPNPVACIVRVVGCQLCYLLAIIAESAMLAERYSLKPSFSELSPED